MIQDNDDALPEYDDDEEDLLAQSLANAPVDDEPLSDELAAALDDAHASIARGEGIPHGVMLREFGFTREI